MKRRGWLVIPALTLLLSATASVSAAPGMADNPVITQRYIEDVYMPSIRTRAAEAAAGTVDDTLSWIQTLLNAGDMEINEKALTRKVISRLVFNGSGPVTLKSGSMLTLGQGTSVQVISGALSHDSGTLANTSVGRDVASKAALEKNNRYFALNADTKISVTADSVVTLYGSFLITPPYEPMYKDLCDALMTMKIINTYALEEPTTRIHMFVIFASILGVKAEAESYPLTHPFTDVSWGHGYVSYAYTHGHTAGTGNNRFSPNDTGSVRQMSFIMLKALGYRDGIDISYATALDDAVRLGLFSRREIDILRSEEFTRDAMMYMTYYSLFATYKDTGERIIDRLIHNGQVKRADFDKASASVVRNRF